ncbi:MAG: ATP-grasp domain-containing protein [Chloroflexi bacterium]|nr:MAG: ATP-grasp domain-containing protein [Chloroflexota bacterium]
MFFVDKPYISEIFKKTINDHAIPVVGTDFAKETGFYNGTTVICENSAVEMARDFENLAIYTTSENSIGWISKHLALTGLPEKIELFKDKLKFRELTKSIFPNLYFREIRVEDLNKVQFDEMPLPFIIKPNVGFFSMGVYKVSSVEEWQHTIELITAELDQIEGLYPEEVLDARSFIVEQCIEGEEFAVDAYFNSEGEPVVLGIFKHVFSSDADVSDRVYISSKEIIERNLAEFTEFVRKIGNLADVRTFPMHIELRRDDGGTLLPIEVNPMRFGGWCTTADLTSMAYGFNPYLYYYTQQKPVWPEILKGKEGKLFSIIVLDNSTGVDVEQISSFDYEKLLAQFEKPIELRKIDHKKYPVFGFLFTETREDNFGELATVLKSDLNEFISTNGYVE